MRKKVLIVAEISSNHAQEISRAFKMIKRAARAGADAVKFQAFTPDDITLDSGNRYFILEHPKWGGERLYDLYKKAYLPYEWLGALQKCAAKEDLVFFATAFSKRGVDELEKINVPMHKISSFELNDPSLIEYAAATGKPIILSTGMATFSEIESAVRAARRAGSGRITLLKCTSAYPASPLNMNLRTIPDMKRKFGCEVGLSDHTIGIAAPLAAVSLGATVIEKHFTIGGRKDTPDEFFSIKPEELKELVSSIRAIESVLGEVSYRPAGAELNMRKYRRSLFVSEDVGKGEVFTEINIRSVRPGYGMPPATLGEVLGKRAKKAIKKGSPLNAGMILLAGPVRTGKKK
ncbi:MAG: pseudaminic acid synthase [Candidatus Omnitrophica bacterium]|nr:pseudaminic acid synthase [Candidatus Omnitrophota bacterium]